MLKVLLKVTGQLLLKGMKALLVMVTKDCRQMQ